MTEAPEHGSVQPCSHCNRDPIRHDIANGEISPKQNGPGQACTKCIQPRAVVKPGQFYERRNGSGCQCQHLRAARCPHQPEHPIDHHGPQRGAAVLHHKPRQPKRNEPHRQPRGHGDERYAQIETPSIPRAHSAMPASTEMVAAFAAPLSSAIFLRLTCSIRE